MALALLDAQAGNLGGDANAEQFAVPRVFWKLVLRELPAVGRPPTDLLEHLAGAPPVAVIFGWLEWARDRPGERRRLREMYEQYRRDYDEIIYGAPALIYDAFDEIEEAALKHDRR